MRVLASTTLLVIMITTAGCGEKPAPPVPKPQPQPRRVQPVNYEYKVNGSEIVYTSLYGCFTDGVEAVLFVDDHEKDRTSLKNNDTVVLEELDSFVLKASGLEPGTHECVVKYAMNGEVFRSGMQKTIEIKSGE